MSQITTLLTLITQKSFRTKVFDYVCCVTQALLGMHLTLLNRIYALQMVSGGVMKARASFSSSGGKIKTLSFYKVREVGGRATWSLSSCKPGFGVEQLRDDRCDPCRN